MNVEIVLRGDKEIMGEFCSSLQKYDLSLCFVNAIVKASGNKPKVRPTISQTVIGSVVNLITAIIQALTNKSEYRAKITIGSEIVIMEKGDSPDKFTRTLSTHKGVMIEFVKKD